MPKNSNDRRDMTPEEIAAREEKFRSFFTTTAANIPAEMALRDDEEEEKPKKKFGFFGRGKAKQAEEDADRPLEMPTGEVLLGADAQPEEEADLELVLKTTADPEPVLSMRPLAQQEPAMPVQPEETTAPEPLEIKLETEEEPAPAEEQKPEEPAPAKAEPLRLAQPEKKPKHKSSQKAHNPKNAPEVLLPQEEQEQQEMAQLKALIGLGGAKPTRKAAAPAPEKQPEPKAVETAAPEPEKAQQPAGTPLPTAVFAAAKETPAEAAEQPTPQEPEASAKPSVFEMFGTPEDEEKPQAPETAARPGREDTMSLPLLPLDEEAPAPACSDHRSRGRSARRGRSCP